jgi:hypothetical protein
MEYFMNLKTCAIYLLITLSTAAIANNHGLQKVPGGVAPVNPAHLASVG